MDGGRAARPRQRRRARGHDDVAGDAPHLTRLREAYPARLMIDRDDRYAEIYARVPLERARAVQHRAGVLQRAGRSDRARFALYWEDESGATAAYTFWDLQQQANRLSNALAALGVGRGDKRRADPAAAARDRGRAHRGLPDGRGRRAAVVPVRPRGARIPARAHARRRSRSSIRSRCRISRRSATAVPASRTSIGVAGAREACVTPWETLLARASPHFDAGRRPRPRDPALLIYTSGTTGPPKGALMPQRVPARQPAGLRALARRLSARGRPVLVAGRLGVDRRPDGRAAAGAVLRPADRRLSRPLRPRARVRADREVRGPQRVPVPDRAQDDDEGVPAAARALRRRPAHDHERGRGGRHDGVRLGARRARRDDQRDVRPDRDELHRRQLARAVAGEARLDGTPVSRATGSR